MKNKLIIILGPTASGKTDLAIKLAKKFHGEIISADSRQIYRGMKIGTAAPCVVAGLPSVDNAVSDVPSETTRAPTKSGHAGGVLPEGQQRSVPRGHSVLPTRATAIKYKDIRHYLIGFLEPDRIFSVAEFKDAATAIANDIISRRKIPIICGGTAHYLQAITENLSIPRVPPNWKLRKRLEKKDLKELVEQLKKLAGKKSAGSSVLSVSGKSVGFDLKNKRRVIRALEVCKTGYKFSEVRKKGKPIFNILQVGIKIPRKELYRRIDKRVEEMIKEGLIQETKNLQRFFVSKIRSTKSEIRNRLRSSRPERSEAKLRELTRNKNRMRFLHSLRSVEMTNKVSNFSPFGRSSVGGDIRISSLKQIPALSSIGYKEIIDCLAGKTTLKEAAQKIKYRTHKYVRYQMGWFRKNEKIKWVKDYGEAEKMVKKFLSSPTSQRNNSIELFNC